MNETSGIEELMDLFDVRVDAFAICEIERTAALRCEPVDKVLVHFVLKGEGTIQYENGSCVLGPNTVIVVPPRLHKVISGPGPISTIHDAEQQCPLNDQLSHFKAGDTPDLVLGCAVVQASLGGALDLFEHLWEPMVEDAAGAALAPLFGLIEQELASPSVGMRAVMGALMKQVLIGVFRAQLLREPFRSWLWPAMMDPKLGKAAVAIMAAPREPHTIKSLAGLAGMSPSRFIEHFTNSFGRSPIEFLQAVRLRQAQRLLTGSSLPVKSIATAVGYASRSHFSRCFSAKYGSDPSSFRQQARAIAASG